MRIVWSAAARADVERLYAFLAQHDLDAADAVVGRLARAPESLLDFPRRGSRLGDFNPREIRELRVGRYVLRYELVGSDIFVLRFFHGRENRA